MLPTKLKLVAPRKAVDES